MKQWLLLTAFLATSQVFAQGALLPEDLTDEVTIKFKKEMVIGPRGTAQLDLFFIDGILYNAQDFIQKSQSGELRDSHNFCLITANRKTMVVNESKTIKVGMTISLDDKESFGAKNITLKDHLGTRFGLGNGFNGIGEMTSINPKAKLERFNLKDDKEILQSIYCFQKIWSISDTNAGWFNSLKDLTLEQALGNYAEINTGRSKE